MVSICPGQNCMNRKILQRGKVIFEISDNSVDDPGIVVGILQKGRYRRAAAQQEAIIAGKPEIRIYKFGVPALHLFARRKKYFQLIIRQWLRHTHEGLSMKDLVRQRTD